MRKRTQSREFVLKVLYQSEMNPAQLDKILQAFWEENSGASGDMRDYTERLARGTVAHLEELDTIIKQYTENWQLNRMAVIDRNILRFATFELLFFEDVPPKVTINEAVNIAKKYSQEKSGKFVNGVLDKINHTEKSRTSSSESA